MLLYIADVDGVLTDARARPNNNVIALSAKIGHTSPFAYVTGRSARWLEDHIIPVLEDVYRASPPCFSLLCAEYGGVLLRYDHGVWSKEEDSKFSAIGVLRSEARLRIAEIPGVFFDESKDIMVSVEARHDLRERAHEDVERGLARAEEVLKELAQVDPMLEYQRTTYACDLVPRGMNKAYGADRVLSLLGVRPSRAELFGDAPSDFGLAEPFVREGIPYTVNYVGKPEKLGEKELCHPIVIPSGHYDLGMLELLASMSTRG